MAHVVRVATVGLVCWIPAILLPTARPFATLLNGFKRGTDELAGLVQASMVLLVVGLTVSWWWSATRSYLHMPHAPGVGVYVTVVAILVSLSVLAYGIAPLV